MKVLHVISSLALSEGGPSHAIRGLANAQAADATVLVASAFAPRENRAELKSGWKESVQLELLGPARTALRWARGDRARIRNLVRSVDIVHIHGVWERIQLIAASAALESDRPFIVRPCGMLAPWSLQQNASKKRLALRFTRPRLLDAADAIHFTTQSEADTSLDGDLLSKAIIEPNGIDASLLGTPRAPAPDDPPYILFLGRLHPKKGVEILIEAFDQLIGRASTATESLQLRIAGDGNPEYVARLRAISEAKPTSSRVRFLGPVHGDEKVALLSHAKVFCLPSYQENFGIAAAEALASGTPILVSEAVDLWWDIKEEQVGEAAPQDPRTIATTLERLLSDNVAHARMRENARRVAHERFRWESIAKRWREVHYPQLLSNEQLPP